MISACGLHSDIKTIKEDDSQKKNQGEVSGYEYKLIQDD